MKKLFWVAFVVMFGLSACATSQAVRQQPEPVLVEASVAPDPKNTVLKPEGCVMVEVDYTSKLRAMYKEHDSDYNHIHGIFDPKPRATGKVAKEVCWFKFNQRTTGEVARERIEASGKFLVADLWELNSFGTTKPDLQRKFEFIGLGSQWRYQNGNVDVPVFYVHDGLRSLSLRWQGSQISWNDDYSFLAVRIRK